MTPSAVSHSANPPMAAFRVLSGPAWRLSIPGLAAAAAWLAAAWLTAVWPDRPDTDWAYTRELAILFAACAVALACVSLAAIRFDALRRLRRSAPWLLALALFFLAWEAATAKYGLLPLPFFPPPQAILEVLIDDWARLSDSIVASLLLLAGGVALGGSAGFLVGVAIGWSRAVAYWIHPILRFIGPLPATAWLPLAFFIFPSSHSASVPDCARDRLSVAVLTWSGIAGVNSAYYEHQHTLGAGPSFLVPEGGDLRRDAHVFVGLFMVSAILSRFAVAEMLGVKSGLGWYLQWAQGWAAYANMYAALFIMALVCSGVVTLLFRLRDRLLSWQRGLMRW